MSRILSLFLLPPLNFLVFMIAGFVMRRRWRRTGNAMIGFSIATYLLFSTSAVSVLALGLLEDRSLAFTTSDPRLKTAADAIVVLGGGRTIGAPELGGRSTVQKGSLERLRFAARLAKASGKPILVTGGTPGGSSNDSEAELMKETLEQDFAVHVRWVEGHSVNTIENARFSKDILFPAGIKRIFLVTHAFHMPRAVYSFEKMGFTVIPVPVGFVSSDLDFADVRMYFPSPSAMGGSMQAIHEYVGLLWYKLRF